MTDTPEILRRCAPQNDRTGRSLNHRAVVTQTTANGQTTTATHTLDFTYDASGSPVAVSYDGTTYYYATNLQGDVVAILNGSGSTVVSYTYDAWGYEKSCTGTMASTLGQYNPLRYRGYVYDTETESYYLQSRYYDPTLGRFLNADAFTSTGQGLLGNNMFAYCGNNPSNNRDNSGDMYAPAIKEERISLDGGAGAGISIPIPWGFELWLRIEREWEEITQKMSQSLARAATRNYRTSEERHHIAARKAPNAAQAAAILNDLFDQGVESDINLVMLKTPIHRRIHTNLYYSVVNEMVISAYEQANGDRKKQTENVSLALNTVRVLLEIMNAMA